MKTAKTIAIYILATLLFLSLSLNTFLLVVFEIKDIESFKQTLLLHEIANAFDTIPESEDPADTIEDTTNPTPEIKPDETPATPTTKVLYEDQWIKVTLMKIEPGLLGPSLKLQIENLNTESVYVSCREVYIEDFQADLSGFYCECLDAGKKAIEDFTIWESDYKDFTSEPKEVSFVIEVLDPNTLGSYSRSERITVSLIEED